MLTLILGLTSFGNHVQFWEGRGWMTPFPGRIEIHLGQLVRPGANYKEPATAIISHCTGIYTDQSNLRYFSCEIGQFQST